MKQADWIMLAGAAAVTVIAGAWYSRRAAAAAHRPAVASGNGVLVPLGFSWDAQRGAFTKTNADGEVEVYGADLYL